MTLRRLGAAVLLAAVTAATLPAQTARPVRGAVHVDRAGILRWTADGREVVLFGVNYAAPFAYDFRALQRLGVDHRRAIDDDVAHFARLGVDAFRIHVWDREVSDRAGTLLENEHLALLDYLLARLAERGIHAVLTPIAWWGPGYPEPDPPSPGFSNGHTKQQMVADTGALRRAQARYLAQFAAHVNPHRGLRYADDPQVIAFEVFNEPWHAGGPAATTRYVNEMVAALRGAGVTKPIFYNISEKYTDAHGRAVCAADIQGVTAQWYPTGLVRGATLPGNPLPNVDRYPLPWAGFPACRDKARMVYEFDGADVAAPVMYPAMARAFRGAGFQWATQFAYDPLAIAHTNTEYQTHFLNLSYTPAKAISFVIAGEVFRRLPRGHDAGTYPRSEQFGPFRVSHADATSEMVTDSIFLHAAPTRTRPPSPVRLRRIAGIGSSPLVAYEGTGAYFLDRLADGIWRLEVHPDAVPVHDPFSPGSLERAVTRIQWHTRAMRVMLPDLGADFTARALDAGNAHVPVVTGDSLRVRPGAYLLARRGVPADDWTPARRFGVLTLGEFVAPPPTPAHLVTPPALPAPRSTDAALVLADGAHARDRVVLPGFTGLLRYRADTTTGADDARRAWEFRVSTFGPTETHVAFRTVLDAATAGRLRTGEHGDTLRLRLRSSGNDSVGVDVALVLADGSAWGTTVFVGPDWSEVSIPTAQLRRVPIVLLPRPYPTFLPYELMADVPATRPDLRLLEGLQWGLRRPADDGPAGVVIDRVTLR